MIADAKFRDMSFGYDANGRMVKAARPSLPDALSVYDASDLTTLRGYNEAHISAGINADTFTDRINNSLGQMSFLPGWGNRLPLR